MLSVKSGLMGIILLALEAPHLQAETNPDFLDRMPLHFKGRTGFLYSQPCIFNNLGGGSFGKYEWNFWLTYSAEEENETLLGVTIDQYARYEVEGNKYTFEGKYGGTLEMTYLDFPEWPIKAKVTYNGQTRTCDLMWPQ